MAYLTQFSGSVPVIKFNIDQSIMTIGQHIDMDICVSEDGISDNHAALEASKNDGVYRFTLKAREDEPLLDVNGDIVAQADLKDGDWIVIGGVEFQFSDDGQNDIKDVSADKAVLETEKQRSKAIENITDALSMITSIKEEVKAISPKNVIEESRFSRRLNLF